jgi:hypothetical protein
VLPAEIAPGLLRWTARHPEWNPDATPGGSGDWDPAVGSVLYEPPGPQPVAVALIDPLLLAAEGRAPFQSWLDERVAGRQVSILTTVRWHRRDREELAERYKGAASHAWNAVPRGIEPRPLRGAGETLFWLPGVATLVAGDRLIGAGTRVAAGGDGEKDEDGEGGGAVEGHGLRVCPESWLEDVRVDRVGVAGLMRPLLELPIERVLVSHGEPVLGDGRAALAHAIAEAEGR